MSSILSTVPNCSITASAKTELSMFLLSDARVRCFCRNSMADLSNPSIISLFTIRTFFIWFLNGVPSKMLSSRQIEMLRLAQVFNSIGVKFSSQDLHLQTTWKIRRRTSLRSAVGLSTWSGLLEKLNWTRIAWNYVKRFIRQSTYMYVTNSCSPCLIGRMTFPMSLLPMKMRARFGWQEWFNLLLFK